MSTATLDDLVCEPLGAGQLRPEWYHQGPVIEKRVGDRLYAVWANGTFSTTSPDGNRFKGCDSAHDWLSERNVTDDHALEAVLNSEAGWDTDMNRWFELIVFDVVEKDTLTYFHESSTGVDIYYEFDAEVFVDSINNAIASDAQEVGA